MPRRRHLSTPVVVIGCAIAAALLVGISFVAFDVAGDGGGESATSDVPAAEDAASPPTEDRLTTESRLGYAGLGPLQLGMSKSEATRASGATFVPSDGGCSWSIRPDGDFDGLSAFFIGADGLVQISVANPAIRTISGIGLGSSADDVRQTYSNASTGPGAGGYSELAITNPEGRHIRFFMSGDRVIHMELTLNAELSEGIARC
jgi:hypothetical protein